MGDHGPELGERERELLVLLLVVLCSLDEEGLELKVCVGDQELRVEELEAPLGLLAEEDVDWAVEIADAAAEADVDVGLLRVNLVRWLLLVVRYLVVKPEDRVLMVKVGRGGREKR